MRGAGAVSTNGSAVDSFDGEGSPVFDSISFAFGGGNGDDGWIEQIIIYPAGYADLDVLSALS